MKKISVLLVVASLMPFVISAQNFFNHIYVGGGVGVNISSDYTDIAIQPTIGYRITNIFSVGIFATYEYSYGKGIDYSANSYGGGLFGRAEVPIIPGAFGLVGHAEYSFLNSNIKKNGEEWSNFNNFLPVGVGIYTQSGRTRISLVALWDVFYLKQYGSGGPTLRANIAF
ncbi:MAG: hypothetical protein LBH91_08575 [Prevotellaceae bacterium]|jgi:hypothetical protein|nr:hypothetical protein [Prevotellaceae bacterium]